MRDHLIVGRIAKRREAQQHRVVTVFGKQTGLGDGLRSFADGTANPDEGRRLANGVRSIHFLFRQHEHGLEQTDPRIADRELRRVDTDRQTSGTRG
jgi:hypothetical protein